MHAQGKRHLQFSPVLLGRSCKIWDNFMDSKEHWQATTGGFCCGFVADRCCNCTALLFLLCLGWPTVTSARASLNVRLYVSSVASKDLNLPLRYVHTRPLTLLSVKSKHLKIHYLSICTTQQLKMCIISITKRWNCHIYFFLFVQYRWRFSYTVITIKLKYIGCELLIWDSASLYKRPCTSTWSMQLLFA